jgi:hypothetical protein
LGLFERTSGVDMQTQEFAKNPIIKANVRCGKCNKQFKIEDMLREEPLPYPNVTIVEGFLKCPNCQHRTHNYYLTEMLRQDQVRLKEALLRWQKERSSTAWTSYVKRKTVFQNNYDRVQERLRGQFEKEARREQSNTNA